MKSLIYLLSLALVAVLLVGCSGNCCPDQTCPPTSPVVKPQADGDYLSLNLPCKCGGVIVYVPDSCVCFDREHYPDLYDSLQKLYGMFNPDDRYDKVVGKYENVTLTCGCTLCCYVPGSCGCLGKRYPEIEAQLAEVYGLAQKYREPDQE